MTLSEQKQLRRNVNNQKEKNVYYRYNLEEQYISIHVANEFKIDKITKNQKSYLIKNIQELNKTIYQQKLKILADAKYYYSFRMGLHRLSLCWIRRKNLILIINGINLVKPLYLKKWKVMNKQLMYDQAIKLYPIDGWIYARKASALKKMEQYEQAIMMYDQAIELDQKNGENYIKKASALKKMKKYEQALLVYHQAIYQLDPKDGLYYIRKAYALKTKLINDLDFLQQIQII